MLMKDMGDALAVILEVIENQEKITIFGDYDADGLTAAALLSNFFSGLQIPISFYIPDRLKEGYGLNRRAIERIARNGTGLIITVDCGISNAKEIALAKTLGMKVVVTDHHQIPDDFKLNCPVINPQRPDCPFSFKDLAGVGLAFFLAVAIRTALREKGWFITRPEPDLREYLDLVAIGTVADRVPLLDQNRILVNSGMEVMEQSRWAGIQAIKEVADIKTSKITTDDVAFRLAPRLNAPGRMGDPVIGARILTVEEPQLARDLALSLDTANTRRQSIERYIFDQICNMIETTGGIEHRRSLVLAKEDWHKGVLGIVASRLVDKYHLPSLVLTVKEGVAAGSGRSIDGFDLYKALSQVGHLFEKFGGHAHAAGMSLRAGNLEMLKEQFERVATETLSDEELVPSIHVDAEISLRDMTPEMVRQITSLSPFGEGNPEPLFLARSLEVLGSWIVGERHLKLRVRQGEKIFDAIGFGLAHRHSVEGKTIDMVFTPELNRWQGYERVQVKIADLESQPEADELIIENPGCKFDVFGTEYK
jgi:single-stranded-DNA-specific exonuclease